MKNARQLVWMLFFLLILASCSRRELLDGFPVVTVQVTFDWSGIDEASSLPEGMRMVFYPKDVGRDKVDVLLPVDGGEVELPLGNYSVVAYNYDTEVVNIRGDESYETIEAYTGTCRVGATGTEKMVWEPDALYVVNIDQLEIKENEGVLQLPLQPKGIVKTYPFSLKAKGLNNVASAWGSVDGMAECYFLGKARGVCRQSSVYFDAGKSSEAIEGNFSTFGPPDEAVSRAGREIMMTVKLMKVDRSVQEVKLDITQVVIPSQEGSGTVSPPGIPPSIELPEGNQIEVEDALPLPGGGGIGGDVGDWDDEEEVVLPMK